jgi:hypothetical protein
MVGSLAGALRGAVVRDRRSCAGVPDHSCGRRGGRRPRGRSGWRHRFRGDRKQRRFWRQRVGCRRQELLAGQQLGMRHLPSRPTLRPNARMCRLRDGWRLPGGSPLLRSWELCSMQNKQRLRRHDPELLARQPDVPPCVHEQRTVRPRWPRANLQHEHGGLRRLQRVCRLPDLGERLRRDDASMCAVL